MMRRFPYHIGIIPDGNRRWASGNGLNKEDGYAHGLAPGVKLLRAARECGVKELTYYGFTVDNCKRPKAQVEAFSKACCRAVELIEKEGAIVRVVGNSCSPCFPADLIDYTKNRSAPSGKMRVNLLVNYGWEWDMQNDFASRAVPRIDLVVRWGGMCRLSGFLPLQTVYSDIYVVNDLWPDYDDKHLDAALDWYSKQDITLGG